MRYISFSATSLSLFSETLQLLISFLQTVIWAFGLVHHADWTTSAFKFRDYDAAHSSVFRKRYAVLINIFTSIYPV